jgi:hypothetical protein
MENINSDNESITYEAILLLSIFILMKKRDSQINNILVKNGTRLIEFIENFKRKEHKPKVVDVNTSKQVNLDPEQAAG